MSTMDEFKSTPGMAVPPHLRAIPASHAALMLESHSRFIAY